jgi:hypothetical protein
MIMKQLHRTCECYRFLETHDCVYAHVASTAKLRPASRRIPGDVDRLARAHIQVAGVDARLAGRFSASQRRTRCLDRLSEGQARKSVYTALESRGFSIEAATVRADGSLVSARQRELSPIRKAA